MGSPACLRYSRQGRGRHKSSTPTGSDRSVTDCNFPYLRSAFLSEQGSERDGERVVERGDRRSVRSRELLFVRFAAKLLV
jgi:hypothetical protein